MKTRKLKYMFAVVLMAFVAAFANNVQASMPNAKVRLTDMINSRKFMTLSNIVDGGDDTPVVDYQLLAFNSGYGTGDLNPVNNYTILDNVNNSRIKAYAYNYGNVDASNRVEVKMAGTGYTDNDKKIGLALNYGLSYLDPTTAENQEDMDQVLKTRSFATQLYIWMVTSGRVASGTDVAFVSAFADGDVMSAYSAIRTNVENAQLSPSQYAYADEATSKANKVEMKWNAENGRYEITIPYENAVTGSYIVPYTNGVEGLNCQQNPGANSITFYTTQQLGTPDNPVTAAIGKATGAYYPAYADTVNGERLVYESYEAQNQSMYYISFYTNALKVEVQKSYGTHPQNSKVGDAKIEGAVYGVYKNRECTDLVEQIVTDANGKASSRPLELADYYVKEIAVSEGCKIDTAVHDALQSSATTDPVSGQKVITVNSTDQVIYGDMNITVSVSDLSGHTTKDPAVNSKITVTLDSNPSESYEGHTDEYGNVKFKNIPYGHYTIKEVEKQTENVDFMDPINVFVSEETEYDLINELVNDEVAQRYVRIEKVDAETGKMIPSDKTTFEVWDKGNNKQVSLKQHYQEEKVVTSFETKGLNGEAQGFTMLPDKLPYGTYEVRERIAPTGYYNEYEAEGKAAAFAVETNTAENPEDKSDILVQVRNMPQKINLSVNTRGDVLTETTNANVNGYDVKVPSYSSQDLVGAKYRVTANEDIVTGDGTVRMKAGEYIEFESKEVVSLYIGSYTLTQVEVPEGYVLDTTPKQLNYTAKAQTVKEWSDNYVYYNQRQTYTVDLEKTFKDLNFFKKNTISGEIINDANFTKVLIGIYAAEDIVNVAGNNIIPKDTLVDVVRMNADGTGRVSVSLPTGKFYAKELETDINYEVSEDKYAVNAIPEDNVKETFSIKPDPIVNVPKVETTLTITKVEPIEQEETIGTKIANILLPADGAKTIANSDVDVLLLKGAEFGVYYTEAGVDYPLYEKVDGKFVEVVRTTDKEGKIVIEGLPFGSYKLKELKAPKYYDLSTEAYAVTLTPEKVKESVVIENVRTLVDFKATVVDEDGTLIEGATVELVDADNDMFTYTAETDENGVADFGKIRAGKYVRKVSTLEKQYVVPEDKTITVVDAENGEEETIEVKFVRGNILVFKTDEETGEPLPGSKFQVTDENGEVVAEGETDENGYFYVEGLRYGEYYVEETEAPEGYENENVLAVVNIEENGKTYEVDITNMSTGDIAVALYAMMAIVSLAAIVVTVKKLKMN